MRQFTIKALAATAPFLLLVTALVLIDPYNFFGVMLVSQNVKMKTSHALNPCIWRMVEYRRTPQPNILLGNSRMAALAQNEVSRVSGAPYFNFAYGGGSLNEMIDTFWYAASLTKLQNVYMGINFVLYSDYNYTARTESVQAMFDNPLLYFTNRTVLKAAYYNARMTLSGADPQIGVTRMTKEQNWRELVGPVTGGYYSRHVYPVRYRKELVKISEYCRKNSIGLHFIILPSHMDVQSRVGDFHLENEYERFKSDLASLGLTYDYDYENALTTNAEDYRDPIHFGPRVAAILVGEIWGGQMSIGR